MVECVQSCKYLASIDSKLNFEANCETVCKKVHQCLFCLRKESCVPTDKNIMASIYCALIE